MVRPVLLRIPWSHYCRKAEWGLTQAGIPYDTLDVGFRGMRQIERANPEEGTVPVLAAGAERVPGSARILSWADRHRVDAAIPLYPKSHGAAVRRWEAWADDDVGPVARREAYRAAYHDPGRFTDRRILHLIVRLGHRQILGVMKFYKSRRFDATDAEAVPKIVAKVSKQLRKSGTGYLFTDGPTAADIATAALMEPLTYAARCRGYGTFRGWEDCAGLVARVRPEETARIRRRPMRERHWRDFESLHADRAEKGEEVDVSVA